MTLDDVLTEASVAIGWGENTTQKLSILKRGLTLALEEIDPLASWRCAIVSFSKTVPANKNKVSVSNINLFKPIVCKFVDSDSVEYVLTHREMTNFEILDADYGTGTNTKPTIYSIAGGYIYVGPGIMAAATSIQGMTQRRLTLNDVEQLPGPMLVDGMVKRMAKDPDVRASARISWYGSKKAIVAAASKRTGEERDTQPLDPMIVRNQRYLASI